MTDKKLFTPGPLSTSHTVKEAMLRDVGSRDVEFIETVRDIRTRLLGLASVDPGAYTAVLMQGSGTFAIESVIGSALPHDGRLLVLANGAYGERIARIASVLGIDHDVMRSPEDRTPDPTDVDARLARDRAITLVAYVHCETTSGILNPIETIGAVVRQHGRCSFVDAMSSFGATPIDFEAAGIDYKFEQYYDFREPIKTIPSHRFLAGHPGKNREFPHPNREESFGLVHGKPRCCDPQRAAIDAASLSQCQRPAACVERRVAPKLSSMRVAIAASLLLSALAYGCSEPEPAGSATPEIDTDVIAFVNVNVVPMTTDGVLEHYTVLVNEGRISDLGRAEEITIPIRGDAHRRNRALLDAGPNGDARPSPQPEHAPRGDGKRPLPLYR